MPPRGAMPRPAADAAGPPLRPPSGLNLSGLRHRRGRFRRPTCSSNEQVIHLPAARFCFCRSRLRPPCAPLPSRNAMGLRSAARTVLKISGQWRTSDASAARRRRMIVLKWRIYFLGRCKYREDADPMETCVESRRGFIDRPIRSTYAVVFAWESARGRCGPATRPGPFGRVERRSLELHLRRMDASVVHAPPRGHAPGSTDGFGAPLLA